jgi:predicted thioesterase
VTLDETAWVPAACTLPTAEQPLRVREFEQLFARALTSVTTRPDGRSLRLVLTGGPEVYDTAADLAARESECCSFFLFNLDRGGETVTMDIRVDHAHVEVLRKVETLARAALRERQLTER